MMCVVATMAPEISISSPIGSTLSAYDSGAFHPGTSRFPEFPPFV